MILFQLGDVMFSITPIIVDHVGWSLTLRICGLQGAIAGILGLTLVAEPSRVDDDEEEGPTLETKQEISEEQSSHLEVSVSV